MPLGFPTDEYVLSIKVCLHANTTFPLSTLVRLHQNGIHCIQQVVGLETIGKE